MSRLYITSTSCSSDPLLVHRRLKGKLVLILSSARWESDRPDVELRRGFPPAGPAHSAHNELEDLKMLWPCVTGTHTHNWSHDCVCVWESVRVSGCHYPLLHSSCEKKEGWKQKAALELVKWSLSDHYQWSPVTHTLFLSFTLSLYVFVSLPCFAGVCVNTASPSNIPAPHNTGNERLEGGREGR